MFGLVINPHNSATSSGLIVDSTIKPAVNIKVVTSFKAFLLFKSIKNGKRNDTNIIPTHNVKNVFNILTYFLRLVVNNILTPKYEKIHTTKIK